MLEGVRVETSSIDLDPKQLFDPDIAQMDARAEMIQQRELAGLVRRLENSAFHAEGFDEALRKLRLQLAFLIKESDVLCAFSPFDNNPQCARVQPLSSPFQQSLDYV